MAYKNHCSAKKVSNHQLRRDAMAMSQAGIDAIAHAQRMQSVLFAVLAQVGGEVTVTDGTINQIGDHLANFSVGVLDGQTPGEHIVRLIEDRL